MVKYVLSSMVIFLIFPVWIQSKDYEGDLLSMMGGQLYESHLSSLVGIDPNKVSTFNVKDGEGAINEISEKVQDNTDSASASARDSYKKDDNDGDKFDHASGLHGHKTKPQSQHYSHQKMNITVDNVTYYVNTSADNTTCTPECFLNCQVHFPDPTEEKYCLINVCKCELVREDEIIHAKVSLIMLEDKETETESETATENPLSNMNTTTPLPEEPAQETPGVGNINYKFNEKLERQNFYIIMGMLFILMVPLFIYYLVEMIKNWGDETICYDYPYTIDEYKLLSDLNEGKL